MKMWSCLQRLLARSITCSCPCRHCMCSHQWLSLHWLAQDYSASRAARLLVLTLSCGSLLHAPLPAGVCVTSVPGKQWGWSPLRVHDVIIAIDGAAGNHYRWGGSEQKDDQLCVQRCWLHALWCPEVSEWNRQATRGTGHAEARALQHHAQ